MEWRVRIKRGADGRIDGAERIDGADMGIKHGADMGIKHGYGDKTRSGYGDKTRIWG